MSSAPLRVLAEEVHNELPMPAYAYGIIALVFFAVLLGVLWSFRNTGEKYAQPDQHGHGDAHGTTSSH